MSMQRCRSCIRACSRTRPSGAFSLNVLYDKAQAAGRLWGLVHDGSGSMSARPEDLAATEREFGGARLSAFGAEEREG